MTTKWRQDSFSWIRGANYVPSYASNDVAIWRDFDAETVGRELGFAETLGLNSIRIFLQYIVWKHEPALFRRHFQSFLGLCAKRGIRAMPVLFDSCFGQEPEIDWNGHWVMNPGYSREASSRWSELEGFVDYVVGEHVGDDRIVMWDVMNEPAILRTTIDFVRHWLAVVRKTDPSHPTTIGVAGNAGLASLYADHEDVLGFHSYSWPSSVFRSHITNMKRLGKQKGKPILISEVGHWGSGQSYEGAIPILEEEGVGWYFWELMIAKTQFNKWQGVVYPDGAIRDAAAIAAISRTSLDKIPFKVKPLSEGVPYEKGTAHAPSLNDEARQLIQDLAETPATPENLKEQASFIVPFFLTVMHQAVLSEEELIAAMEFHLAAQPAQGKEPDLATACDRFETVKAALAAHLDEVDWNMPP
jgi:hypothetical protein